MTFDSSKIPSTKTNSLDERLCWCLRLASGGEKPKGALILRLGPIVKNKKALPSIGVGCWGECVLCGGSFYVV